MVSFISEIESIIYFGCLYTFMSVFNHEKEVFFMCEMVEFPNPTIEQLRFIGDLSLFGLVYGEGRFFRFQKNNRITKQEARL